MPLYLCFCPDYPNSLDKRLAARADHLAASKRDKEAGKSVFGRAFVDERNSHLDSRDPPQQDAASPGGMEGSTMIWRYPTLDQAWERIKKDPYWTGGVWDKEKLVVKEFATLDGDDTLRLVTA